jgi:uncharacterized protein YkwD
MPVSTTSSARRSRRTALAIGLLLGLTSVFTLAAPAGTLAWDSGTFSSASEADLVTLTNRSRANAGLKALKVDSTLRSVARWRSKDMIVRDYFSHTIPGYGKVWDKLQEVGYCYKVAGENIGWNNYPDDIATAAIHDMFMNSEGHRANILGKTWDVIGIGAYKGPTGKKMWTVLFADKCGTTSPPATPKPTKPVPKSTPKPTAKAVKATPRPTPRPATVATPQPSPEVFPEATPPFSSGDLLDPSLGPEPEPTATPSEEPLDGAVGMRVVDRDTTDGLLGTIVGGVAGFFFGG